VTSAFAAEQRTFDIPAESADSSVQTFAEQAGLSVLYEAGLLTRFRTQALKGDYEPVQALAILLEGSGLTFSMTTPRVISVKPAPAPKAPRTSPGPERADLPTVHIPGWMSRSSSNLPAGVTLHRVSSDDLAQAGFVTVPDWVRSLTQNQGSGATEDTRNFLREAPTNNAFGSGINFYGIGQRATLILVNGRRLAPSGSAGTFTDVSNIPISAIDHIDVISDGAATLYGSDAVGGVINFVLRGALSAPVSTASIGHLTRGSLGEKEFSQSLVKQWDRSGGVVSLEYYSRNELPASARRQATSDLTLLGGSNFNTPAGNPATIIDSQGRVWGVPAGQNGTALSPAQLLPRPNTYDTEVNTWLLPHQERLNLLASATRQIADDTSVFFDALVNRRRINILEAPLSSVLSVPNSNPFYLNPVAGSQAPLTVLYGFGKDLGPVTEQGQVDSGQFALGLNHELSPYWNIRGYVGYTYEDQHDIEHNLVNFGVLQDYLASGDKAKAFNPFGDGSSTNPLTIAAIREDGWLKYDSAFTYVNLSAIGAVPFLPAGPMTLTAGSDYRVQTLATTISPSLSSAKLVPTPATNRQRTVSALFLQSSVPVLSPDWASRWSVMLAISGGLRYEHFSDAGAAITPGLGFDLQPEPGLSLKGTWARLFRPPNLPDLNEAGNISEVFVLPDPQSRSGYTQALVWTGNNSGLRAETAHTWTLGLTFSPPSHSNFTAETNYFNIVSSNRIPSLQPLPVTLFSDPQYSYLFTRNVTSAARADVCSHGQFIGPQDQCLNSDIGALVDLRLRNVETLRTDGIDFNGRYGRDTPAGTFGVNLTATYILHYKEAETPGGALVEYRNTPHNPTALRLRSLFNWEKRGFSISPALNFQGSYVDTGSIQNRPVGAWMTWDLVLGYKTRPLELLRGGETTLSLRGYNVFNKQPPFLNNGLYGIGYDPENGDLLGRRVSLAIEHKW
jgi:outer membrane receptor protein involved in Fe transport